MRSAGGTFTQAWAPSLMRRTSDSMDGTGVAWGAAASDMSGDLLGSSLGGHLRRASQDRHALLMRRCAQRYKLALPSQASTTGEKAMPSTAPKATSREQ